MEKISTKREVRQVVALLSLAILCAGLLSVLMLYVYSPSGRYLVGNTLLAPSTIHQINIKDKHPQTGQTVQFVFDRAEFSYFDKKQARFIQHPLSFELYDRFYRLVSSEKSLEIVDEGVQQLFHQSHPALLTIRLRTDVAGASPQTKIFQVVQVIPQDYFRIQLRGERENEWAYFYQAGIYQTIMHLFAEPS